MTKSKTKVELTAFLIIAKYKHPDSSVGQVFSFFLLTNFPNCAYFEQTRLLSGK